MDTKQQLSELYKAFDYFNKNLFGNKLPKVVIVLQTKGKNPAYGWFTPAKVWTGREEDNFERHEISISTEHINRENIEIIGTLIHEMIHLYNFENKIKDVSRQNRYHNKKFMDSALKFGMIEAGKHDKIGYLVKPNPINQYIKNIEEHFNAIKFNSISRLDAASKGKDKGEDPTESKVKNKKYIVRCEDCGTKGTFTMPKGFTPTECVCNVCGSIVTQEEKE